ncbi:alpha/beta fold hydrolase [Microbulbifer sp. YPW1]|uniref:alpha/beta fold hydrolase n=1 Tax=Microbulbifer sp. YPW1 TaxID=2745199 RepID=UPI001597ACDF|nr:alpha/beta fold hydrolase [Microbulbifer sp. YPW1]QKX18027.1 alpha/beta fold hydrolase [Microbulbifer sp. YPW1]
MPTVHHDGRDIYYECTGNGPVVVLLHSFLCDGEMWNQQLTALAGKYRVINVDLRGHGKSSVADTPLDIYAMTDDVIAVLDKEQVTSATWAGLSIGGMIALRAALTHPERVSGLILLDTHAGTETRFKIFKYKTMVAIAKLLGISPLLPTVAKLMFGKHTLESQPGLVEYWKKKFAAMSLVSIENVANALCARDSLNHRLSSITQPALVLVGHDDISLPPACSEALSARLPHAQINIIPRAGHLSTLEQPQAVNRAMLDYLTAYAQRKDSVTA